LLKVGGHLAVDDHHRGNRDTDAVATALKRTALADPGPSLGSEARAVTDQIEKALGPHKCLSLGATLPEAERLFLIRHREPRYIFLDALGMVSYLRHEKSRAAYDMVHEAVGLISRAWRDAYPEWAEQVMFIAEKDTSMPGRRASRSARNPQRSL